MLQQLTGMSTAPLLNPRHSFQQPEDNFHFEPQISNVIEMYNHRCLCFESNLLCLRLIYVSDLSLQFCSALCNVGNYPSS